MFRTVQKGSRSFKRFKKVQESSKRFNKVHGHKCTISLCEDYDALSSRWFKKAQEGMFIEVQEVSRRL